MYPAKADDGTQNIHWVFIYVDSRASIRRVACIVQCRLYLFLNASVNKSTLVWEKAYTLKYKPSALAFAYYRHPLFSELKQLESVTLEYLTVQF